MITKQTYSLLALTVYAGSEKNTLNLPPGWEKRPNPLVGTNGFAYAVYENASAKEIVISYRGTDNWLSGDAFTNFGVSWSQ